MHRLFFPRTDAAGRRRPTEAGAWLALGDHAVFKATGHWVPGHTLRHLVASGAAWPVVAALRAAQRASTSRRARP